MSKKMQASRNQSKTIDEYIATYPQNVREILEELRRAIRETAPKLKKPQATEYPHSTSTEST